MWEEPIDPVRHVLENRNLKIFVLNDNTKRPGHGEMEVSTRFLEQAKTVRDDVVSYLDNQPMGPSRMDMVFSWIAPCRNERPDDVRSGVASKAGYTGPISEIFTTSILIVEGTQAVGGDLKNMQNVAASLKSNYKKYFHGAKCAVKKDYEVTQDDINNHSLVLVGNPRSNSVWEKLQSDIPINVMSPEILYKNEALTGNTAFQAIVPHPFVAGKYILMIGAGNLQYLRRVTTNNLFSARYDCLIFGSPRTYIGKLDDKRNTTGSGRY